jgi:hypothetical protein
MFRYWFWRYWKYPQLFKNKNGISQFGEICLNSFSDKMSKLGKKIRENIEGLTAKRSNLRREEDELLKSAIVEHDEFHTIKRRVTTQSFLVIILVLAEFGLNYFTTFIIFGYDKTGIVWVGIRLAIALAVTVMAIVSTERFLEEVLPKETRYKTEKPIENKNFLVLSLWLFCLIAIEIAIYFFGLLRAHDFEGGGVGNEVVVAMIILSMIIPIVAGGVMWDVNRFLGAYKTKIRYDKIQKLKDSINTTLNLLRAKENTEFQRQAIGYWNTFNIFKVHKENYNVKNSIDEDITLHDNYYFIKDFDSFNARGTTIYQTVLGEVDKLTKLDRTDTEVGNRLGQKTE